MTEPYLTLRFSPPRCETRNFRECPASPVGPPVGQTFCISAVSLMESITIPGASHNFTPSSRASMSTTRMGKRGFGICSFRSSFVIPPICLDSQATYGHSPIMPHDSRIFAERSGLSSDFERELVGCDKRGRPAGNSGDVVAHKYRLLIPAENGGGGDDANVPSRLALALRQFQGEHFHALLDASEEAAAAGEPGAASYFGGFGRYAARVCCEEVKHG